jgi:hypothetical protein
MSAQLQLVHHESHFHFIGRQNRSVLFTVQAPSIENAIQQFQNAGHSYQDALFIIQTNTQIFLA